MSRAKSVGLAAQKKREISWHIAVFFHRVSYTLRTGFFYHTFLSYAQTQGRDMIREE
jgi:hypothetical protein